MIYSRTDKSLAGRRFGALVVLFPDGKVGKHASWRCRCDCGLETVVLGFNLKSSTSPTKSCGRCHLALRAACPDEDKATVASEKRDNVDFE